MAGVGANGVLSEGVRTGFLANTEAEMTICLVSKMRRHKSASSSIVGVDKTTEERAERRVHLSSESSWIRGSQCFVGGIDDDRDRGDATRLGVENAGSGSRSDRVHLFGIWASSFGVRVRVGGGGTGTTTR